MPKFAFLNSKRLFNMTQRLKGSKSVHASDESCHIMYVTEIQITFCDYFSYFIYFWLHLDTHETVGGIIMYVNLFNNTIIYECIVGKLGKSVSIYIA